MPTSHVVAASVPWLLRFRWIATLGQLSALVVVEQTQGVRVWWWVAGCALLVAAAGNVVLSLWWSQARARELTQTQTSRVLATTLAADTVLLTILLSASGGPTNPFTIWYVAQTVLAALVLESRWTGWLTVLAALCFGSLFFLSLGPLQHEMPHAHAGNHGGLDHSYSRHLWGMWIAFAGAAIAVAYFVRQISRTLDEQRHQIARLRERAMKTAHLASLTTLAAGAAHELRTPLATIAIAAHEMHLRLQQGDEKLLRDTQLIEQQTERCQSILSALGPRFTEESTMASECSVQDVFDGVAQRLQIVHGAEASRVVWSGETTARLSCPRSDLEQALLRLISNGLDASRDDATPVEVAAAIRGSTIAFEVRDVGVGMLPEVVERAAEPFFTTKRPGAGMGLGLFLVNTFALSRGGELQLESEPGRGTTVRLVLPASAGASSPGALA